MIQGISIGVPAQVLFVETTRRLRHKFQPLPRRHPEARLVIFIGIRGGRSLSRQIRSLT
jgi:hypothetical protein